jgi:predicted transcriptional regulator
VRTAEGKAGPNNVRKIREGLLLSKAELARRAGISVLTLDRVEKGNDCRMDTKRKIILALGLQLTDRDKVFSNP